MTNIAITRFNNIKTKAPGKFRGKQRYERLDTYVAPVDLETRCYDIVSYIDNCKAQLIHNSKASGISFASWKGSDNKEDNLLECHALVLDYPADQFEQLMQAAANLGYAHLFIMSENKASTINAVTLVIPFSKPVDKPTYARVAACIVTELNIYNLMNGALAATHIIDIHFSTMSCFERGELMDAQAFKVRTAKLYQGRDATKYYHGKVSGPATTAQLNPPVFTTTDELFLFPEIDAEAIIRKAQERIYGKASA